MKSRLALIVIILAVGMRIATQEKGKAASSGFVQQAFAAWNSHDPDKVVTFYTEDVVYEDVAYGTVSHGRSELRKFSAGFFEAVPDLKLEVVSSSVHNGHGAAEWVLSGTDKGLYKTGKKFSVRGASMFEMRGVEYSSNKDFYDLATIMRQVGVSQPEKLADTSAASSSALDAVTVDKHYTVDFENDRVRVVRVQYGPHEKSVVMHEHPGTSVGIYLTDFHANITFSDRTREVNAKAGKTIWRAPAVRHLSTENLSDQPMEALWVELKSATASNIAEQEVRQVERELTEALGRGDLRAAEGIYADDYTLTSANGEFQDKPQRLAALKLSDPKTTSRNRDDIKVRIYGDTAVVTGRTLFRELVKGVERTEGRRFTHVFVKRQGQWQMVASQVTPVTSGQATEKKASDEIAEQTVRASDEDQQDRNTQSEAEARRVIDAFNLANNRRDVEGLRNALNFPFVRIASGKVSVTRIREEFAIEDWPPGAAAEGWHHSTVDSVQFVQSSTKKVHAIVIFSRYQADGTRYATYRTLRIITNQDGHWGIQCSSSFAP